MLLSNSSPPANQGKGCDLKQGAGLKGAWLEDIVALSRVELRVVSVRHDAAVLTVVHLGC